MTLVETFVGRAGVLSWQMCVCGGFGCSPTQCLCVVAASGHQVDIVVVDGCEYIWLV